MKSKNLEFGVLGVGVLVMLVAVYMMFGQQGNPGAMYTMNLIYAVGFLIYILYSMMSTSNLNREIRQLNGQINGLKEELAKNKEQLRKKSSELEETQTELARVQKELKTSQDALKKAREEISSLKTANEANNS